MLRCDTLQPRPPRASAEPRSSEVLASEMVIDAIVQPEDLRDELVRRFARYAGKHREWPAKRHGLPPV